MKITVAGIGYVGLSLAVLLAQNNEVTTIVNANATRMDFIADRIITRNPGTVGTFTD